jgi:phage tail sheath protein FI
MFVERSIFNSTHWIVFENNGPNLWARIKSQVQGFLQGLFDDGMLAGNTPSQAFFVTVDETNNTEATQDAGYVIIDVGIAPHKPAEFVRFRFQQKTLDS